MSPHAKSRRDRRTLLRWTAVTAVLTLAIGLAFVARDRRPPARSSPAAPIAADRTVTSAPADPAASAEAPAGAGGGARHQPSTWAVTSPREKSSSPPAEARRSRAASGPGRPPRFKAPEEGRPPPPRLMDFHQLMATNQPLAAAWSIEAKNDRPSATPMIRACVQDQVLRKPELNEEGALQGSLAVTFQVNGGTAQVLRVEGDGRVDQQFADCFARASKWVREPIAAPGAKDGTVTVNWPYRLN
jgi:hypothetical protein